MTKRRKHRRPAKRSCSRGPRFTTGRYSVSARDEVLEPGGLRTTREVITHPGSVVVLPVLADGRIVMIRQYRHAARQHLWELVAGRIDRGESPKKGGRARTAGRDWLPSEKFKRFP